MLALPAPLDTLGPQERSVLDSYLEPVSFAAGSTIFLGDGESDGCYLIDAGEVRLELPHPELDTEGVLGYLGAGSLLGELALLDRLPRSASAYAETPVQARKLSVAALDELQAEHPRIATQVVAALGRDAARKLRGSNAVLAEHLFADTPDPEVDEMVGAAKKAQAVIATWDEQRIDALLADLAGAVAERAEELARDTVEETHVGNVPDKTMKNTFASLGIYHALAGKPGQGQLGEVSDVGVAEIASAAGVIFALAPMTNPVATAVFKALIAIKSRNAIILSFHRAALGVGNKTGELLQKVLRTHGAPVELVQWVKVRVNRKKTQRFMSHPDVSLVLATGGPGMVRAAYSSGNPAIGVGPGNTPAWVAPDADLQAAAQAIVMSKSFDNGLICGSEHNLVVDRSVREPFLEALERAGAAVLRDSERDRFLAAVLTEDRSAFRPEALGQAASTIAAFLKIERDHDIKLIVVPTEVDLTSQMAGEKLTPVLSLFDVDGDDDAIALSKQLLAKQGTGHTAIIHSKDPARVQRFGVEMPVSRILVNSAGAHGVSGITTGLEPSFTLGCGTFGGNSTTDNVTFRNLQNIKRMAYPTPQPAVAEATAAAG
ncbi:MAG: aldehyde dehydrogenase family protein [Actinomycetota bacterium]|nr:aldehyde dehydrogenase family protein [Actinomycetota bacterium]